MVTLEVAAGTKVVFLAVNVHHCCGSRLCFMTVMAGADPASVWGPDLRSLKSQAKEGAEWLDGMCAKSEPETQGVLLQVSWHPQCLFKHKVSCAACGLSRITANRH